MFGAPVEEQVVGTAEDFWWFCSGEVIVRGGVPEVYPVVASEVQVFEEMAVAVVVNLGRANVLLRGACYCK